MKAFWASIILFALLIGCIILNARYLRSSADDLHRMISALEHMDGREEVLAELEDFWEENKNWIGLTVGFRELDHFGELIAELRWAHDNGNEIDFGRCRSLLKDAVEELVRTEELSVRTLL